MPRDESNRARIAERKRVRGSTPVVSHVNSVTPGGYQEKTPAWYDFYEGEYPLDWDAIDVKRPNRLIFQATVGRHGRHWNDMPDYAVERYVGEALAREHRYGLYHLLVPNSISEQVDFYSRVMDRLGGPGQMPPIVDIEYEPPIGRDTFRGTAWAGQIYFALDKLTTRYGQRPLIYWSKKFASFCNDRQGNPPSWMGDFWHWLAGYPWTLFVDANKTMPQAYMANGVVKLAAWQYAEDGRYRGKASNDLSLVYPDFISYLTDIYGG